MREIGDGMLELERVIPRAELRTAIEACCRNPGSNRYFEEAPAGARKFIGLQFYMSVFPDRINNLKYRQCLSGIAPCLGVADIDYVLARTNELETKAYLEQLRGELVPREAPRLQRRPEIDPVPVAPVPVQPPPAAEAPRMKILGVKRDDENPEEFGRPVKSEYERQKQAYRNARRKSALGRLLKAVVLLIVLAVAGYVAFSVNFAGIQSRLAAARPKEAGLRADLTQFKEALKKAGYGKPAPTEIGRLRGMCALLSDATFKTLDEKYLGAASAAQTPAVLDSLSRQIAMEERRKELQGKESRLRKSFRGSDKSPSHQADVERTEKALKALALELDRTHNLRLSATSNVLEKVNGISSRIGARLAAIAGEEQKLEEAQEWRRAMQSLLMPDDGEGEGSK